MEDYVLNSYIKQRDILISFVDKISSGVNDKPVSIEIKYVSRRFQTDSGKAKLNLNNDVMSINIINALIKESNNQIDKLNESINERRIFLS